MRRSLTIAFCLLLSLTAFAQHQIRVATYNVIYTNSGDSLQGDGWKQRYPVIKDMVLFHDFDIFGTQEGKYVQQQDLLNALPGYSYIGEGRDDGKTAGEYSSIFYKKDKFKLLKKGHFWFAPETDKPVKGWDAALPRICSWGQFKDNKSGLVFYFFNLHFDHVGVQARRESAKLILAKIKEFTNGDPIILTGDFNVDQFNESYTLLNTSGVLRDVYELAPVKLATHGTFNSFDAHTQTESRIDHIFITKKFKAERYGILSDTYFGPSPADAKLKLRTPSDHYAVMAVLSY
jgi:endonuclease/exonuclease/phosphatase family metal-dependent hydrolase